MEINFNVLTWQEGKMFVAYVPELDVSSCGKTLEEAQKNIYEAVQIFLQQTEKMGTLEEILEESGFGKKKNNNQTRWLPPRMISTQREKIAI